MQGALIHILGFVSIALLFIILGGHGERGHLRFGRRLKTALIWFAATLSVVFVLAVLFVILPLSEMEPDNESVFQAWAIAFVDTTLPFLARTALTVFITLLALGSLLDTGWIKIGRRKRNRCADCPSKPIALNHRVETEVNHDENKN